MPEFTNPSTFPAFHELPSSTSSAPPADNWFLLAQIKENMTITKTTLVVRDRAGVDFAVTFDDGDHRGLPTSSSNGNEPLRFRKGHTLVVPRATRTDREGEGKKAVVRVPAGQSGGVRVVPGSLEQVLELGQVLAAGKQEEEEGSGVAKTKKCAACGEAEVDGKPLLRCTGCGAAAYCSKACQVRGWSELGHKSNCKVVKSIREIWP